MEETYIIKEVIEAGNELARRVGQHPAIIRDAVTKKGDDSDQLMDLEHGDLLSQIEEANQYVAEIDSKIKDIHKAVKGRYSVRYPELNLTDPMQYIQTVQLLGNQPKRVTDDESIKAELRLVLDPKMHLLVTMTAATTQGVKIEKEEMGRIMKACAVAVHLFNLRSKFLSFVESNMTTIAPNLSVIVGAPIAAKLMGIAGGIAELANKPPCNLVSVSRISRTETNINSNSGLIYACDLIQQIPFDHTRDVRKRAVRWVANKCALAARCDANQSDRSGNSGKFFRVQIEKMIAKELEPPPKKAARPLPAPIEKSGKKRGGKRVRRNKERYAQTELRKAANRMNFGEVGDDAYQHGLGFDRTRLNATKQLRGPQINEKTKIRLSKKEQKRLAKDAASGANGNGGANSSGQPTAKKQKTNDGSASIVFKPQQQGLEIFNPNAAESYTAGTSGESSNYFSNTAGFSMVQKEKKGD